MNKEQAKKVVDDLNWKYDSKIKLKDFMDILYQQGLDD